MERLKTSFIATIYNEEKTVYQLLNSLAFQTVKPDEIIITDGGSTDRTTTIIKKFKSEKKLNITMLQKKGNRAVGRNLAIQRARYDIILCSDAGCTLDKNWVRNITKPFIQKNAEVVAGYYRGVGNNLIQRCLIPYVLVMPDRIDPQNFLPATRSVAFSKKIWQKIGRFNEGLSHNEDYAFARELKKHKARIIFASDAIVYWTARSTFESACIMFFRFAFGDAEAGIVRPKVVVIFIRYIIFFFLFVVSIYYHISIGIIILCLSAIAYCFWAILKSYNYIKDIRAMFILPIIQVMSDVAVLIGTTLGILRLWDTKNKR